MRSPVRALKFWPFPLLLLAGAGLIAACVGNAAPAQPAPMTPVALLGEKIFNDPTLSASGRQACASCHQPAHAGADAEVVPTGGPAMNTIGFRNAPSVRYLDRTPAFHFEADGTPVGGFNRDGRAQTLAEQARRPFTAPHEMANADAAALVARLRNASYVDEFRAVFGANALDDPEAAFTRATAAVATYERENPAFHPYSSRYDAFLAGQPTLNAQELRGLKLFNDPQKGNCAACHPSQRGDDGAPPLFTDFSYDNLGVPRNPAIPATADPNYYDLGLCGPDRVDLADRKDLCGAFKVPTLRNIAVTAPYFHNGRFASLTDVVAFYVRRDTHPAEWYPLNGAGVPEKFNDLPPAYRGNVNVSEVPYDRKPGDQPALSADEIDDVVAFLKTLTDADLTTAP